MLLHWGCGPDPVHGSGGDKGFPFPGSQAEEEARLGGRVPLWLRTVLLARLPRELGPCRSQHGSSSRSRLTRQAKSSPLWVSSPGDAGWRGGSGAARPLCSLHFRPGVHGPDMGSPPQVPVLKRTRL